MSIKEGNIVMLKPEATYYNGKEIPDWVKVQKWVVKSVSGDRAVIDLNENGTHAICSPVHTGFLTVAVETGGGESGSGSLSQVHIQNQAQPSLPPQQPCNSAEAPVCSSSMSISQRGVELIAKYEGCRLEAYKCPAGVWTIGYGHTAGVKPGDRLPSREAALVLLKNDLVKYAGYVNTCMKSGKISFKLTQNQFDALTSFVYNCGNGSLQKLVTGNGPAVISEKILLYNKGGGKVLQGLIKRRQEEHDLYLS